MISKRLASPVIALVAIAAFSGVASAATPTTTQTVAVSATGDGVVIDLAALNSQFTKMTLTGSGTAHWGEGTYPDNGNEYTTSYDASGHMTTGVVTSTGIAPGWGPIIAEGTQVGAMVYRIDGGTWQGLTEATTISVSQGTHVQVAYNDRPGSYNDNAGSLNLTVVRSK